MKSLIASFGEITSNVKYFLKQKIFVFLLIFTCVLSYGFAITHYAIGLDDTTFYRFFYQGGLLVQGRFGLVLLNRFLFSSTFTPFWTNFLAVFFLFWSALLWSSLIKYISSDKLSILSYIIFSTVFVSYPLIYEIFVFSGIILPICLCYGLTAISVYFCYLYTVKKRCIKHAFFSIFLTVFVISVYESFAVVFLTGYLLTMILDLSFVDQARNSWRDYIISLFKFGLILLSSVFLKSIISIAIIFYFKFPQSNVAANRITWFASGEYWSRILLVLKQTISTYFLSSFLYLSIATLMIASLLLVVCMINLFKKTRSYYLMLLIFLFFVSIFSLTLIQCSFTNYRACQVYALFVGFIFMLTYSLFSKKWIKGVFLAMICLFVLNQTKDLNQRFFNNYLRYQEEKRIIELIGTKIEAEFDRDKPVVFISYPELSERVTNFAFQNHNSVMKGIDQYSKERWARSSVIRWGISAFNENSTELLAFFYFHGYSFKQADSNQYLLGRELARDLPIWPKKGSIQEFSDFILVNFGEKQPDI